MGRDGTTSVFTVILTRGNVLYASFFKPICVVSIAKIRKIREISSLEHNLSDHLPSFISIYKSASVAPWLVNRQLCLRSEFNYLITIANARFIHLLVFKRFLFLKEEEIKNLYLVTYLSLQHSGRRLL